MPDDEPHPQQPAPVQAVQVKLPPFWPTDPELWIAQVEAQFRTRGITQDSTKYDHVIGSLSPETAMEIRDVLLRPPENGKYESLKTALLRRNELSDQKRLQELLSQEDLGDRKPSQVLRRMQQLVGDKAIDDNFLRSLFIQKLPPTLQTIMVTAGGVGLNDLAEMADKMLEVTPFGSIQTVTTPNQTITSEVGILRQEVAGLKDMIRTLTINSVNTASGGGHRARSSSRGRSPYRRPRSSSQHSSSSLCWYHHRFGDKSHKCVQPCSWDGQGNGGTGLQEKR